MKSFCWLMHHFTSLYYVNNLYRFLRLLTQPEHLEDLGRICESLSCLSNNNSNLAILNSNLCAFALQEIRRSSHVLHSDIRPGNSSSFFDIYVYKLTSSPPPLRSPYLPVLPEVKIIHRDVEDTTSLSLGENSTSLTSLPKVCYI